MDVMFFASPAEFRAWLEANHEQSEGIWVGYYKKATGKPSMTWPESVDQALCYGWIDSVRNSIDDESYKNRFTPRKPRSTWSNVNVKRVRELTEQGLMTPAGLRAFESRRPEREGIYSSEQGEVALDAAYEQELRANPEAWAFFEKVAPSYKKAAIWWVMSAKQEATRLKRLATLIEDSARGLRVAPLRPRTKAE
jgi:uncharacterized protein YdeI (YjbR/CyaY-like superfamily)